jgi:plasmid stabilization system protein ParE
MNVDFHPLVKRDLREILDYYDARSDVAGDRFFAEFEEAVRRILDAPMRCHPLDTQRRRCNLHKFPHHLVFEIEGDVVWITVLRHDKRRPGFGLRRRLG